MAPGFLPHRGRTYVELEQPYAAFLPFSRSRRISIRANPLQSGLSWSDRHSPALCCLVLARPYERRHPYRLQRVWRLHDCRPMCDGQYCDLSESGNRHNPRPHGYGQFNGEPAIHRRGYVPLRNHVYQCNRRIDPERGGGDQPGTLSFAGNSSGPHWDGEVERDARDPVGNGGRRSNAPVPASSAIPSRIRRDTERTLFLRTLVRTVSGRNSRSAGNR